MLMIKRSAINKTSLYNLGNKIACHSKAWWSCVIIISWFILTFSISPLMFVENWFRLCNCGYMVAWRSFIWIAECFTPLAFELYNAFLQAMLRKDARGTGSTGFRSGPEPSQLRYYLLIDIKLASLPLRRRAMCSICFYIDYSAGIASRIFAIHYKV